MTGESSSMPARECLRFGLLVAVLALGCVVSAVPARALDANAANAFVTRALDDAVRTFSGKTMSPDDKARAAQELIGRYADLRGLSAAILGRYWTGATPDQQAKFPPLLVQYALSAWAPMGDIGGGDNKMRITSTQPAGQSLVVHALIGSPGEQPTPLDWTVSTAADGRLILTDVVVDNVGFIRTMHDDFSSFLASNGGRLDTLMAAMQKKIDANAAPAAK
jgi:phospholipid transport system substrate-binding protein